MPDFTVIKTGDPRWNPHERLTVNGYTFVPLSEHDRRVTELLEANNRYLERAREAERERDNCNRYLIEYQRALNAVSVVLQTMLGDIGWPNVQRADGTMPSDPLVIQPILYSAAPAANAGGDHEVEPTPTNAGKTAGAEQADGVAPGRRSVEGEGA